MDSSVDDKKFEAKVFSSPKSSGTLLGRLPLNLFLFAVLIEFCEEGMFKPCTQYV